MKTLERAIRLLAKVDCDFSRDYSKTLLYGLFHCTDVL